MNGAFYQGAGYVPPGGTKKEKQKKQDQWHEWQRLQTTQRKSMSDIAEEPHNYLLDSKTTSRRRADSLQPVSSPPLTPARIATSLDTPAYCTAKSTHPQSPDYDVEYSRRFSSAEEYNSMLQTAAHSSPPVEIRRLSGNFNAPTHVELERHKDFRRRSRGMDKIKNAVRGWAKA